MFNLSPLADRMRPRKLKDVIGQEKIIGPNSVLAQSLAAGHLPSLVLWGPPGCGKTTIARLLAKEIKAEFLTLQAVTSGLKEFRKIINQALENKIEEKKTVLFIDEIHRWNKKQQDALLHYVEDGTITFIGATTENPSFEVISALLSRLKVMMLEPLTRDQIVKMLKRALEQDEVLRLGAECGFRVRTQKARRASNRVGARGPDPTMRVKIGQKELEMIAEFSGGDARIALNALELCVKAATGRDAPWRVSTELIKQIFNQTNLLYDKAGEEHYNLISAFIKSLRGSDADAAVYYLARMIEGGEKPEFIARRMLIFASEDIGNALPTALVLANSCFEAIKKIGWPESQLILSQTAIYLAKAPKSNLAKRAIISARLEVQKSGHLPIPMHLRNAPTKLMKDLGYGQNYIYTPDDPLASQEFLPKTIKNKKFVQ